MTNKFHPPDYIPTEQEHKIAYLKYCLEELSDSVLGAHNPEFEKYAHSKKAGEADIKKRIDRYTKDYTPIWQCDISYDKFKNRHIEYLSSEHHGDCVLQAVSCVRCHTEELYEIPSSVTWCSSCEIQNGKYCNCKKDA